MQDNGPGGLDYWHLWGRAKERKTIVSKLASTQASKQSKRKKTWVVSLKKKVSKWAEQEKENRLVES